MRAAPPVQALSRAAGAWRMVQCVLCATAAGSLVFWAGCWWAGPGVWSALAGGAAAALAWVLVRRFDRPAVQRLRWDGNAWFADAPGTEWVRGRAVLVIDLGAWVLVRFFLEGHRPWPQSRWLPLSRTDNHGAWHGLRVALHARASLPEAAPMPPVVPGAQ
jgi:hypothetical protein